MLTHTIAQLTNILTLVYLQKYSGGSSVTIYAPEDAETKELNAVLHERKENRALREKKESEVDDEKPASKDFSSRRAFTWEKLNYHVPVPGGTLRLLHDVNGYVKPGTLTALMGASGAGECFASALLA
jgi:ABC-type glutathione transport system ATPase component